MAKKNEVMNVADQETLDSLAESYPVEKGGQGIMLPRIGMFSQDKTEESGTGRNKKINVIAAAGEFYIDQQTEEVGEDGKKQWAKQEIGDSFEGIIFFKRYQLSMYDEATEKYTSSPVFDKQDEVVPLFCDKKEVARGLPADLKLKYVYTDKTGKERSALEENRILYILWEGKPYQMNLRGSSMYSLLSYEKTVQAPTVITRFSSEAMKKGEIAWNKMTFFAVRKLTPDEATEIKKLQQEAIEAIKLSKASYAKTPVKEDEHDKELDSIAASAAKKF